MEDKVPVISTATKIERYGFWRLEIFERGSLRTPVVLYDPDDGPEEYRWIGKTVGWLGLYLSKRHNKKTISVETSGYYGLGVQLFIDGHQLKYLVSDHGDRGERGFRAQFSIDEAQVLASASLVNLHLLDKNGLEDRERSPLPFSNVGLSEALAGMALVDIESGL
jgi:hypothetical protein